MRVFELILFLLISTTNCRVESNFLNAYEQAIGEWTLLLHLHNDFTKKGNTSQLYSLLFPIDKESISTEPIPPSRTDDKSRSDNHLLETKSNYSILRRKNRDIFCDQSTITANNPLECKLKLCSDGTFHLEPRENQLNNDAISTVTKYNCKKSDNNDGVRQNNDPVTNRIALRGKWIVESNPYCVTDRQYDKLRLVSYPRERRIRQDKSTSKIENIYGDSSHSHRDNHGRVRHERARLELNCKVWGRYGCRSLQDLLGLKHGKQMARITHGILEVITEQNSISKVKAGLTKPNRTTSRSILASFKAKPFYSYVSDVETKVQHSMMHDDEFQDDDYSDIF